MPNSIYIETPPDISFQDGSVRICFTSGNNPVTMFMSIGTFRRALHEAKEADTAYAARRGSVSPFCVGCERRADAAMQPH